MIRSFFRKPNLILVLLFLGVSLCFQVGAVPAPVGLIHTPILYASPYEDLVVSARPKIAGKYSHLIFFYRSAGKRLYESQYMNRSRSGTYTAVVPAASISRKGLVYFVAAHDADGNEVMLFASPERPHVVVTRSVVLLKSADLELYDNVIQGMRRAAATELTVFDISQGSEAQKQVMTRLSQEPPEVIVTLGPSAARLIRDSSLGKKIPVIYSMVANPRSPEYRMSNATGVSFDISVKKSLETFKSIIPEIRRVGVIYDPNRTQAMVGEARHLAPSFGFEILATRIEDSGEVGPTLRAFEKGIDALWLIPDTTVLKGGDGKNYQTIVEFCRKHRIPLFVFSPDLVRRGALVGLSPDYVDLGSQTGTLVRRVLDGVETRKLPVVTPDRLRVTVNMRTARDLQLEGIAQRVVNYAADQEYPVRVYK